MNALLDPPEELLKEYELTQEDIIKEVTRLIKNSH